MSNSESKETLLKMAEAYKAEIDSLVALEKIEIMESALRKGDIRTADIRFLVRDGELIDLLDVIPKVLLIKAFEYDGGQYTAEIKAVVLVPESQSKDQQKLEGSLSNDIALLNKKVSAHKFTNWQDEEYCFATEFRSW